MVLSRGAIRQLLVLDLGQRLARPEVHSCIQPKCLGILCWCWVSRGVYGWEKARFLISSTRPTWFCASGQNSQTFRLDARMHFPLPSAPCTPSVSARRPVARENRRSGNPSRGGTLPSTDPYPQNSQKCVCVCLTLSLASPLQGPPRQGAWPRPPAWCSSRWRTCCCVTAGSGVRVAAYFVPGLPHVILIQLAQRLLPRAWGATRLLCHYARTTAWRAQARRHGDGCSCGRVCPSRA